MISAMDASALAMQSGAMVMKETLGEIEKVIKQKCEEGEMSFTWYKELDHKVIQHLRELGYVVEQPQFENGTTISW